MIMISQEALQEFKRIWQEEEEEVLSDEVAMEKAVNLLTLFDAIYHPIKQDWVANDNGNNPGKTK